MENNVTIGALKNLVTDKPAPITTKLAQMKGKKDSDGAFALMENNVTIGALKNLVTDKPAPITTKLAQIEKADSMKNLVTGKQALAQGVPIYVNPVIAKDTMGDATLGMNMRVGPDEVHVEKKNQKVKLAQTGNPVWNPPFNNWSVNQPSPPHVHGLSAYQDLGQNMIVD